MDLLLQSPSRTHGPGWTDAKTALGRGCISHLLLTSARNWAIASGFGGNHQVNPYAAPKSPRPRAKATRFGAPKRPVRRATFSHLGAPPSPGDSKASCPLRAPCGAGSSTDTAGLSTSTRYYQPSMPRASSVRPVHQTTKWCGAPSTDHPRCSNARAVCGLKPELSSALPAHPVLRKAFLLKRSQVLDWFAGMAATGPWSTVDQ